VCSAPDADLAMLTEGATPGSGPATEGAVGGSVEAAEGRGIVRRVLPNGIVALARHIPDPDLVAISIGVRAGSRFEDDRTAGAAKFMEKLFLQGTERRPSPDEVQRPVAIRGGALGTQAGSELVIFQAQSRTVDVEVILDVLADVVLHSAFRRDRVENEARVILEELNARRANPNILAADLFLPAVFEGHPLARSAAGDSENTPRLTRDALVEYRDRFFVGRNTVIAVAGNLPTAVALDLVESAFEAMVAGAAAPPSDVPPPPPRARRIDHRAGSAAARIILGAPLPGLRSEDRFPLSVANAVLGPSGFRLFREIRDLRGLSYDPSPGQTLFPDAGIWLAAAGTDPRHVETVIDLLRAQFVRLRQEPIGDDELVNAKNYLAGSLVIGLETPSAQAGQMIRDEAFGSPVLSEEHREGTERVTVEDVQRVARAYLDPEQATLVVVQP
jgi:predicted Zn-dependent peptidase